LFFLLKDIDILKFDQEKPKIKNWVGTAVALVITVKIDCFLSHFCNIIQKDL